MSGYRSSTANTRVIAVANADINNQDFGDVELPTINPNHSRTVLAGGNVFYAHKFTAQSTGSVSFSTTTSGNITAGWSSILYQDSDCSGELNGEEANTPIGNAITTTAGQNICLINKVYAPTNVNNGERFNNEIMAKN